MTGSPIVVVGGGITGAFTAFLAARRGAAVTLIERDGIAAHASGHNAGGLNPMHGAGIPGPLHELALAALRLHAEYRDELVRRGGSAGGARPVNRLHVAFAPEEADALLQRRDLYEATPGFSARWLEPRELRAREPRLSREAIGGLWTEGNAHVDPAPYTRAVAAAAVALGARLLSAEAVGLVHDEGRVGAVETDAGTHACAGVVIAPGPWARQPAQWLGIALPVEPLKGRAAARRDRLGRAGGGRRLLGRGRRLCRGRPGRLILGGTEERCGFDASPTASARERILAGVAPAAERDRRAPGPRAVGRPAAGHPGRVADRRDSVGVGERVRGRRVGPQGHALRRGARARGDRPAARRRHGAARGGVRARSRGARMRSRTAAPEFARRAAFQTECTGCGRAFAAGFIPFCPDCGAMTDVSYELDAVELRESANPYLRFVDLLPVRDPRLLPTDATVHPDGARRDAGGAAGAAVAVPQGRDRPADRDDQGPDGRGRAPVSVRVRRAWLHDLLDRQQLERLRARRSARSPSSGCTCSPPPTFRDRLALTGSDQVIDVVLEDATFVEAFAAAGEFAKGHGLASERGFFNPGRREGLKLAWLEAAEQVPRRIDWYVQAISSAMGVYGVYKAAQRARRARADRARAAAAVRPAGDLRADGHRVERRVEQIRPEDIVKRPTGHRGGDPARGPDPHLSPRAADRDRERRHLRSPSPRRRSAPPAARSRSEESIAPCFAAAAALAGLEKLRADGTVDAEHTVLVNVTGGNRPGTPPNEQTRWLRRSASGWDYGPLLG